TALGLKGFTGLAVNILTDPVTWLLGPIGGLTKAGKASEVISQGLKLLPHAETALAAGAKTLAEVQQFWKVPLLRAAQVASEGYSSLSKAISGLTAEQAAEALTRFPAETPGFQGSVAEITRLMGHLTEGGVEGLQAHLTAQVANRGQLAERVARAFSTA